MRILFHHYLKSQYTKKFFKPAKQAQATLEDALLKDPNVVSVGVVEEVDDIGQKTGDYVVQVGIVSSEVYQNSLNKGSQTIPSEYVLSTVTGNRSTPHEEKHIHIQIVKERQIQALHSNPVDTAFPSAKDELPAQANL